LIGLGSNVTPTIPDSYLRYKSKSKENHGEINIAGATTELTIPLGEEVSIVAVNHEAEQLGGYGHLEGWLWASAGVDYGPMEG